MLELCSFAVDFLHFPVYVDKDCRIETLPTPDVKLHPCFYHDMETLHKDLNVP